MMSFPINFSDPVWLWLAVPSIAIVVVGWLAASRTLPAGRRAASLVIRLILAACLVLSLAGMRLALPSDRLATVFLLDASDSMLDATSEELVEWARAAVREMPDGDRAGVVVFGANALVDRLPSELAELDDPASAPVAGASDVAAAVRLGAAIMPAGMQQRLVLLSDGNDTSGRGHRCHRRGRGTRHPSRRRHSRPPTSRPRCSSTSSRHPPARASARRST